MESEEATRHRDAANWLKNAALAHCETFSATQGLEESEGPRQVGGEGVSGKHMSPMDNKSQVRLMVNLSRIESLAQRLVEGEGDAVDGEEEGQQERGKRAEKMTEWVEERNRLQEVMWELCRAEEAKEEERKAEERHKMWLEEKASMEAAFAKVKETLERDGEEREMEWREKEEMWEEVWRRASREGEEARLVWQAEKEVMQDEIKKLRQRIVTLSIAAAKKQAKEGCGSILVLSADAVDLQGAAEELLMDRASWLQRRTIEDWRLHVCRRRAARHRSRLVCGRVYGRLARRAVEAWWTLVWGRGCGRRRMGGKGVRYVRTEAMEIVMVKRKEWTAARRMVSRWRPFAHDQSEVRRKGFEVEGMCRVHRAARGFDAWRSQVTRSRAAFRRNLVVWGVWRGRGDVLLKGCMDGWMMRAKAKAHAKLEWKRYEHGQMALAYDCWRSLIVATALWKRGAEKMKSARDRRYLTMSLEAWRQDALGFEDEWFRSSPSRESSIVLDMSLCDTFPSVSRREREDLLKSCLQELEELRAGEEALREEIKRERAGWAREKEEREREWQDERDRLAQERGVGERGALEVIEEAEQGRRRAERDAQEMVECAGRDAKERLERARLRVIKSWYDRSVRASLELGWNGLIDAVERRRALQKVVLRWKGGPIIGKVFDAWADASTQGLPGAFALLVGRVWCKVACAKALHIFAHATREEKARRLSWQRASRWAAWTSANKTLMAWRRATLTTEIETTRRRRQAANCLRAWAGVARRAALLNGLFQRVIGMWAFRHWAGVAGEREEKLEGAKTRGVGRVRDSASTSATGEGKESVGVKRLSGSRPPPIQVAKLKGEVGDDWPGKEVFGHVVSPRIALLASPRERRRATIHAMHARKGAGGKGVWKF